MAMCSGMEKTLGTIKHFAKGILRRFPKLQGLVLPAYRRLRSNIAYGDYKLISNDAIARVKSELAGYWHNEKLPLR